MIGGASLRVADIEIRIGEAWTRMPFRYGNACLTAVPLLHLKVTVESRDGQTASGIAADCLPPRWFDKDPEKDFRRNVDDQLAAIDIARDVYLESRSSAASVHAHWQRALPEVLARTNVAGLNRLTGSFGSSLVERAAIDAACRLHRISFHAALRQGVLGWTAGPEIPDAPLESIFVRHTVGLVDYVLKADIPPDERLDDGLPQSLEEAIRTYDLRYFKVKVNGDNDHDFERLGRIADLLESDCRDAYFVSLDGNEQYRDAGVLEELLLKLGKRTNGQRFVESIVFIEQPLARELALNNDASDAVRRLGTIRPVIIDESDDHLDSLPRAVSLGYRGCSIKNCKGVFKALEFRRQIHRLNEQCGEERYFQTGEDLANVAVVPLQQDLTTLAALGVRHAERNGHHYFRGLGHLPESEQAGALRAHSDLYESREGLGYLRIEKGQLRCASLQEPGYGYSCPIAFEERTPRQEWRFEGLGL